MNGSAIGIASGPEDESDESNKDEWEQLLVHTVCKKIGLVGPSGGDTDHCQGEDREENKEEGRWKEN